MKAWKSPTIRYLFTKRTLITCVIALILCATATSLGNDLTNRNLIASHNAETYAKLSLIEKAVNRRIYDAYVAAMYLQSDEEVRYISGIRSLLLPNEDYTHLLAASQSIQSRHLTGDIIFEYALVFERLGLLTFTSSRILDNLRFEYESSLFAFEDMSYSNFVSDFVTSQLRSGSRNAYSPTGTLITADKSNCNVIVFSFVNALEQAVNRPVSLLFINVEKILEQVRPLLATEGGQLLVTDCQGRVLYTNGELEFTSEQLSADTATLSDGCLVNANAANRTDLSFHIYTPNTWATDSTAPIQALVRMFLIIATLMVLGMLALGVVTSSRHISRLARSLEMDGAKQFASFIEVESAIDAVCQNNRQMSGTLASLRPALRAGILESMYKGGILLEEDTSLSPELYKLLPSRYRCCVVSWHVYGNSALPNIMAHVTSLLSRFFVGEFVHPCSAESVAFLADADSLDLGLLDNIAARLNASDNTLVSVAVGGTGTGMPGVHASYMEALSAQRNLEEHSVRRVICFSDDDSSESAYSVSLEQMLKLVISVDSGDKPTMNALLSSIYERNFRNRKYTDSDLSKFNHDMSYVHAKCSDAAKRCGAPSPMAFGDDAATFDAESLFLRYRQLFMSMIDGVSAERSDRRSSLFDSIKRYIDENYGSMDMSLKLVGAHFGITDKYVSMMFKASTGINFSQYVEEKRLDIAISYLRESELSISEIQERCGYSTSSTFYKAFKRRYGVSPSEFRGVGGQDAAE